MEQGDGKIAVIIKKKIFLMIGYQFDYLTYVERS